MTNRRPRTATCALRWLLTRGNEQITCDISVTPDNAFEVGVLVHRDPSRSIVTRFDRLVTALERHADVVHRLGEAGWVRAHLPADLPAAA